MGNIGFAPSLFRQGFCAPWAWQPDTYCRCLAGSERDKAYYDGRGNCVMCPDRNQHFDYTQGKCLFATEPSPRGPLAKVVMQQYNTKMDTPSRDPNLPPDENAFPWGWLLVGAGVLAVIIVVKVKL